MMHATPILRPASLITVALAAWGSAGGLMALSQDQAKPTFRSDADAVTVDVSVRERSGRPIAGLTAANFQVFDNGVPQEVHEVSYGKLPIDVTVALDVSYSVSGGLLDSLRDGVVQLVRDLKRDDRLKLVLFNMRVTRTTDYTTDTKTVERAIRAVVAGGGTSLSDALSVTLVDTAPPGRRQLNVFFTDGSDSSSTTSPAMLTEVARRSRATLTFVVPIQSRSTQLMLYGADSVATEQIRSKFERSTPGTVPGMLSTLATETGGTIVPLGPTVTLAAAFRRALEEFRSAYVLYYTPRGVARGGYHTLDVKVNRAGAQVQARRGYFGS